jgi:hypothetical protein
MLQLALLSALLVRFEASDSIHALAHLIDAVDLDSDEYLTSEELRKYLRAHHLARYEAEEPAVAKQYLEHIRRDIKFLDRDGDGKLRIGELKPETQKTIAFATIDADGDGLLSEVEMLSAMRKDLPHTLIDHDIADILQHFDTDGNERLSHSEILDNSQLFTLKLLIGKHQEL